MISRILSLAVGASGGALFAAFDLPLAWMLGSMTASMILSIKGVKLTVDIPLRNVMMAVLGVMLGSAFSPQVIALLAQWSWGLGLLVIAIFLSTGAVYVFYRYVVKLDHQTSYFSAVPGGFNVMFEVGSEKGGDGSTIALIHASRIALLVMTLPIYYRYGIEFDDTIPVISLAEQFSDFTGLSLLVVCGILGYFVGKFLKLPAPHLMGPLLITAIAQITSIVATPPPDLVVNIAQVVIGTAIGTRFFGTSIAQVRRVIGLSIISTGILMGIAVLLAYASAEFIGVTFEGMTLALAPGGLAEMALVALAMNLDVAFVSLMHVIRIGLVISIVPLSYEIIERFRR